MEKNAKLEMWQERLSSNQTKYEAEVSKMDLREKLYKGSRELKQLVGRDEKTEALHVRNICAEIIEAQVNSSIPQPKVTARREKDQDKAKLIEDMIRNELDRLPMEAINDMMERTVPIQGGALFLLEWDNTARTHFTVGELTVSAIHPKEIVPQDGIFSGIEDMDYVILKVPQSKEYIKRKYGVDVGDETEREPDIKGTGIVSPSDDIVTQYIAYYRNEAGGVGLYSWVNDKELEDLDDYQARRLSRCKNCGEIEDPTYEADGKHVCAFCGSSEFKESNEEYEEIYRPIKLTDGREIPGASGYYDEFNRPYLEPTKIPYYKPNIFPLILQKNVSVYGQLLGDSDIDKIADQQNTTNRIESKIIDKLLKSGSYITLPDEASIKVDADDGKVIRPGTPANKAMIDVYDMQGNIAQDITYLAQVYEEARQIIGITDSFQGRADSTATSGKAKEFAAAQSAGRLESKRTMKDAAYSALFEAMFKFTLAYADEPRFIRREDSEGNIEYAEFNRYDFLEEDGAGNWCWNDQFLFSCDTSAPLASNREAMWQETRLNLQTGAFGNPADINTLILFWRKMEMLHYPGASETKAYLEKQLQKQMEAQRAQMEIQVQAQNDARRYVNAQNTRSQVESVVKQAQSDAARTALEQAGAVPQMNQQTVLQ